MWRALTVMSGVTMTDGEETIGEENKDQGRQSPVRREKVSCAAR